ncbi:MAG: acyl-CoA dehydrogenase family protein [Frankiales bacterium]|nr:acyl-CoA dehydrogenase family protein [Frankiales bacterium]
MDLSFNEADEQFRAEFREWLAANLPMEWRERGFWRRQGEAGFEMRRQWEADKAKAGFAGIQWPKEYGGRGGTPAQRAIYDEEMVRHRAPLTVNSLGLTFLAPTVMVIGTDEQKRDIIKPLLHNEVIWCQGFSEPNAGSDLASLQCRAELDGDEYVINGQKIWTSNAMHASKMFGLFRTSTEDKKHRGITMLLVDLRNPDGSFAPGVDIRPLKQMSGASDFGEVFFTDVRVPRSNIIGKEGGGWDVAMLLLSFERGASALPQYAAFRREVDDIVELAKTVGRDSDALLRQKIASSVVELECLRYHSLSVLTQVEQGKELGASSSMTKLQWSETHQDIGELFTDVAGLAHQVSGDGLDVTDLQQSFLWSRSETIWGGSSQIQRNIVSELVLGLPR